jgi:TldD protein
VLRALAATAAAPAAVRLLGGCRHAGVRAGDRGPATPRQFPEIREQLRAHVGALARYGAEASAFVELRRRTHARVDSGERAVEQRTLAAAVLAIRTAQGTSLERATTDLTRAGLAGAAEALIADAGGRAHGRAPPPRATPQDIDLGGSIPGAAAPAAWLPRVAALLDRGRTLGGSRIVYRAAYLAIDESDRLLITAGRDVRQRITRARGGLLVVAAGGAALYADAAEREGAIGLDVLAVDDAALAAAADNALALLAARAAPAGDHDVLLAPDVAAAVTLAAIVRPLEAGSWVTGESRAAALVGASVGSPLVNVVDDPTERRGSASYRFDDEGWPAARTALIENGVLRAALTDRSSAAALGLPRTGNGRRPSALAPIAARASNVALAAGTGGRDEVMAAVDAGLMLEGPLDVAVDPRRWTARVRIARAREIRGGKLTGRLYGPVAWSVEVPAMLAAIRALSAPAVRVTEAGRGGASDGDADADEPSVSVAAPFVVTRGAIGAG